LDNRPGGKRGLWEKKKTGEKKGDPPQTSMSMSTLGKRDQTNPWRPKFVGRGGILGEERKGPVDLGQRLAYQHKRRQGANPSLEKPFTEGRRGEGQKRDQLKKRKDGGPVVCPTEQWRTRRRKKKAQMPNVLLPLGRKGKKKSQKKKKKAGEGKGRGKRTLKESPPLRPGRT